MGHIVEFTNFENNLDDLFSKQDIIDCIELFYDGPDSKFNFVCADLGAKTRGSCSSIPGQHTITISRKTIEQHLIDGERMGGNKPHSDLKKAIYSVMVHEIQHANQERRFRGQRAFYAGAYMSRPCERDARNFADNNQDVIDNMIDFNYQPKKKKKDNSSIEIVQEIVDVLSYLDNITKKDIIDELKVQDANNPVNVQRIISLLKKKGKKIVK